MSNCTVWTSDRLDYINERYPKFAGNIAEFTEIFNKDFGTNYSWTAIRTVANHILKISKNKKIYRKWTPEMDEYLVATYPTFEGIVEELAEIISNKFNVNITKVSIYNRIKVLGLKKVEGWGKLSEEQISCIRRLNAKGILVKEITDVFNLKYGTSYTHQTMKNIVYVYCTTLGVLTEEQLNYIKETYSSYEGTKEEYYKELKSKFKFTFSLVTFARIIRALGITKNCVHKKEWTPEIDSYLIEVVPTFDGTFEELTIHLNKKFKMSKTTVAVRARVGLLNVKKPPSPFSKYPPEVIAFVKETLPSYKGTIAEYEEFLYKTLKMRIPVKNLYIKDELKDIRKQSAAVVWTPERDDFIKANYRKYAGKTKELLEIFNKKFNASTSLKAFQSRASFLFSNRKYLVKELPPDMNKIDPILRPYVRVTNDRGQIRHKISLAKYNWLMAGNKLDNPDDIYFIYWDDDTTNCDVSNLQLATKSLCSAYGNARRWLPRGDIELNKDVYKRVVLEQLSKDIK